MQSSILVTQSWETSEFSPLTGARCTSIHYAFNDALFVLRSTEYDKYSEDPEFKPATRHSKDIFEEVGI